MAAAAILSAFLAAQAVGPSMPLLPPEPAAPLAAPFPVELSWDAPAGCPDAEGVRGAIARGLPPTDGGLARVQAHVSVTPLDAEHWRAALELRGADWTATRTLKGPSCAGVADAAALVIVMALANERQAREVVVEAAPPPPPPPVEPLSPSSPLVGVGAAVDTSTLPAATPGLAVAVGWRWTRARVDLRGAFFRQQEGRIEDQPTTGANLSLISASARGCYVRGDVISVGPCVAAGFDRLTGRGFGPIASAEDSNIAPFFSGGLIGEWRLSRWVVPFVSAEAAIPLVRARFSVEDVGLVHQAAAVSFRGAAGLELRFR
jgi:hypothetical protein